eukprot:TRINITY_DN24709_c0_g1_i2.p1 TRINITY_DN24709_c0_g1~~TRINITY_DN24709_c0_g1_i2.p1  ORF type:complete len:225 (-),score=73.12 TRINITY_DN24709_c0_g1_i2:14-688(-)
MEKSSKHNASQQLQVSTVDAFQGCEKDIIILSIVRTKSVGFTDSPLRLNVAITRARHHLLVFGSRKLIALSPLWKEVVEKCCQISWNSHPVLTEDFQVLQSPREEDEDVLNEVSDSMSVDSQEAPDEEDGVETDEQHEEQQAAMIEDPTCEDPELLSFFDESDQEQSFLMAEGKLPKQQPPNPTIAGLQAERKNDDHPSTVIAPRICNVFAQVPDQSWEDEFEF